jgi:serine/threonine protein kinase
MPDLFDNRYRFIQELGAGGFGSVFLAKEEKSDHLVAIKHLHVQDKDEQDNLIREMRMISKFNHPHIVNYKHHFQQDGLLYIVMEYCTEGSLRTMMTKQKITSSFIWKWINTLTETLQFVHEKKIVHHDIKPDNILFTEERTIKISDFGIANTSLGTHSYLSPEAFGKCDNFEHDERVDVYSLGVTLLELLSGNNPFSSKSKDEILLLHEQKDFGITHLPNWQQDIILKAIAKIPEQRFQNMKEFKEAIQAKSVPIIFDREVLKAGELAEKANRFIKRKKWIKALSLLDYAETQLKTHVNVLRSKGTYYLLQHRLTEAQTYFEKALKWNPRLDIQKELGWINLEMKNYPTAISLLSDHLHRNPSDYEGYNLLLQCFYETNRYELSINLARTLLEFDKNNQCFENNYYISYIMHHIGEQIVPSVLLKSYNADNPFIEYNQDLVFEKDSSHSFTKHPTLKSKLLFMEYRFNNFKPGTIFMTDSNVTKQILGEMAAPIYKMGRGSYSCNNLKVPGGTAISRRHCLIINCKDDIWLYDLESTGTYLNGERVYGKMPLVGKNHIKIGEAIYELTNDKTKLL